MEKDKSFTIGNFIHLKIDNFGLWCYFQIRTWHNLNNESGDPSPKLGPTEVVFRSKTTNTWIPPVLIKSLIVPDYNLALLEHVTKMAIDAIQCHHISLEWLVVFSWLNQEQRIVCVFYLISPCVFTNGFMLHANAQGRFCYTCCIPLQQSFSSRLEFARSSYFKSYLI